MTGTQDLISHFHLEPLYDTFLRPYLPSSLTSAAPADAADQLSIGQASNGGPPLAPPSVSSTLATTTMTTLPPVPGQVVLPNNRNKQAGAHVKVTDPASSVYTGRRGSENHLGRDQTRRLDHAGTRLDGGSGSGRDPEETKEIKNGQIL